MKQDNTIYIIQPNLSKEWECHLFASNGYLRYTPEVDAVPNWFWRKMQYICFGNKWIKKTDADK